THAGVADFYTTMVRTSDEGGRGISCLLVDGATPGLSAAPRARRMGLTGSPTAQLHFDNAPVSTERLLGDEGHGLKIALSSLSSGRLGIAACAVGLAQAALDEAVTYAKGRHQFGKPIIDFQGVEFLLADMAATVESARATYLEAARRRDRGLDFQRQASRPSPTRVSSVRTHVRPLGPRRRRSCRRPQSPARTPPPPLVFNYEIIRRYAPESSRRTDVGNSSHRPGCPRITHSLTRVGLLHVPR